MPEPRLLIALVGIPGSGKSTIAARACCPVVSSDRVRREVLGDPTDQEHAAEVWAVIHRRLRETLVYSSVVLDATNLDPAHRAPLLAIAEDAGAVPVAWRIMVPVWKAEARNRRRKRTVPTKAMRRMVQLFHDHCDVDALAAEGWIVHDIDPQKRDTKDA